MSLTVNDYSHFAVHNGYLYVYKTPDTADYTISIIGVNLPDEKTASETFEIGKRMGMAIVFKTLQHIAVLNGDNRSSLFYKEESKNYEDKLKVIAQDENTNQISVRPYNMF